jgi:hypothetical protein
MARGKCKDISNRNQGYLASSEPSSPTTASPGYLNTLKKQDSDLKSHFMMIEKFKEDKNTNSLKEIQMNTGKQVEAPKEETQNTLKELQEGTLLYCWWDCKLTQPLWKSVWQFLRKLDIVLWKDPLIPLLGIYPEDAPSCNKDTYSTMFIAS